MFPQGGSIPPGYILVYMDHQPCFIPAHPNHVIANGGRPSENEENDNVNVNPGQEEDRHSNYPPQPTAVPLPVSSVQQVPVYPVIPPLNNMFVAPPSHGNFPRYVHPYSLYSTPGQESIDRAVQNGGAARRSKSKNGADKSSDAANYSSTEYESNGGEAATTISPGTSLPYVPPHAGMPIGAMPAAYSYPYYAAQTVPTSMSAQHATGTPLYIPPMYQPTMFNPGYLYPENLTYPPNNHVECKPLIPNSTEYSSLKITEYTEPQQKNTESSPLQQPELTTYQSKTNEEEEQYVESASNTIETTLTDAITNGNGAAFNDASAPSSNLYTNVSNSYAVNNNNNNNNNSVSNSSVENVTPTTSSSSSSSLYIPEIVPKPTRILGPNDNGSKFFPKEARDNSINAAGATTIRDPAIILEVKKPDILPNNNDANNTVNIDISVNNRIKDNVKEEEKVVNSTNDVSLVTNGIEHLTVEDDEKEKAQNLSSSSTDSVNVVGHSQQSDKLDNAECNNNADMIKPNTANDESAAETISSDVPQQQQQNANLKDNNSSVIEIVQEVPNEPEPEPEPEVETQPVVKTWAGLFKNYPGKPQTTASNAKPPITGANNTIKPTDNNTNNNTISSIPKSTGIIITTSTSATHSGPNENCFDVSQPNLPPFDSRSRQKSTQNNRISNQNSIKSTLANASLDELYLRRIGEFLKNYQLDHRAVSFEPHGFINRGNRCYINATLQALIACPPFFNLMRNLAHHIQRYNKGRAPYSLRTYMPIIDSITQIVLEFTNMQVSNKQRKGSTRKHEAIQELQNTVPLDPPAINQLLSAIQNNETFSMDQQEDAQEFLTCLLNGLNDEMLELLQLADGLTLDQIRNKNNAGTKTETQSNKIISNGDVDSDLNDDAEWKEVQTKNKAAIIYRQNLRPTPLSEIFRGQLRSRLQKIGDQSTNNIEPFFTLHLNIEKAQSVREALELLVGRDTVEGVTSSKTNQEVDAWQQQTLEELPAVLLLHLKCFDYKNHSCSKITKLIDYQIDLLLDPKILSPTPMRRPTHRYRQYKLFAVVYHDGKEATKGHYVTDIFHIAFSGWIRYDDAKVHWIDEKDVLKPKLPRMPYLLYYRRCDKISALMQPFNKKPPSA